MKLRLLVLPLAGVITLLAVACSGEGDTIVTNQNLSGVSATGTGHAAGEPDVAEIHVGVNVERDTVGAAREAAASAQQAVIDSLLAGGVAEEDIQTARFSVHPVYAPRDDASREITGYAVNNVVTAKVRDINTTGEVIDAAIGAGGNDAVVQGVSFTVDDPKELQAEARAEAVELARQQAEQLADAAGESLGDLISISESGGSIPFEAEFARDAASVQQAITPIEAGEVEVSVTVNLTYALE